MKPIDLFNHGVIEAHAGTGKTYTIVGLVLRLLRERKLRLSEILIVTYTEKAAGELTDRIRRRLVEVLAKEPQAPDRGHLEACLKELPECLVGTIHGICLRLLQSYPFESGTPFTTKLVSDDEGVDDALREVLRKGLWMPAGAPSDLFADLLGDTAIDAHLGKARALAMRLLDEHTVLEPSGIETLWNSEDAGAKEACFQARWALAAARLWNVQKDSQGLLSFQDMLANMAKAVKQEIFRRILRQAIRIGIIDEFQDTSRLQWSIFKEWFLHPDDLTDDRSRRPLLYLVGDPKQSIYSFQGADVSAYLEACDHLETRECAVRTSLEENWRSLPSLIEGYNRVLSSPTDGKGWFLLDNERLAYDRNRQARSPSREGVARHVLPGDLGSAPVRIFQATHKSAAGRAEYARRCTEWILGLVGRTVDMPEGDTWVPHTLTWGDFAVIAGSRKVATPFRKAFDLAGIPWSLYKQEGVFSSRVALEVQAVLTALHLGPTEVGVWRKALSTRILDGDEDALGALLEIAGTSRWERLFHAMQALTGVQDRLLGGRGGDREWMDLRQVVTHGLDWLVSGKGGLSELVEHLTRLDSAEEKAQDDRNLHARATERSRVQILTMHASKGLEFPVVFLADGGFHNNPDSWSWIGGDGALRVLPQITTPRTKGERTPWHDEVDEMKAAAKESREQEKRRLHYVGITRPKLLLAMPCILSGNNQHDPLTKALLPLLDAGLPSVGILGAAPEPLPTHELGVGSGAHAAVHTLEDVRALGIASRMRVLTSYSQIQRETSLHLALDGRTDKAEEPSDEESIASRADEWLPRGAHTGDALHEILEAWLDPAFDLGWVAADGAPPTGMDEGRVGAILEQHGLLRGRTAEKAKLLESQVVDLLRKVLTTPIELEGERVRLCDLRPEDRRPEVEFHWAFGADGLDLAPGEKPKGWMVGYIDLLFRHGGRWHVLDWKTTSLAEWSASRVEGSMESHGYLLQADLYRRVVQRALPAGEKMGRAVYVYLRAYADPETAPMGAWVSPEAIQDLMTPALLGWLETRNVRKGRP